jgi:hypothetical protein
VRNINCRIEYPGKSSTFQRECAALEHYPIIGGTNGINFANNQQRKNTSGIWKINWSTEYPTR